MYRIFFILSLYLLSVANPAWAVDNSDSTFTLEMANSCISLNKDLKLASEQMIRTENLKSELASKIHYLDGVISERRQLIEKLDQRNTQQNNDNYNQLVSQYEELTDERRQALGVYNQQHDLHVSQHDSVIRLEQRFSSRCLYGIALTEDVYRTACGDSQIRWCTAFNFN